MNQFGLFNPTPRNPDTVLTLSSLYRFPLVLLFLLLWFFISPAAPAAQERRVDLGLGAERGMDTIGGYSLGPRLFFLADINPSLAAGARIGYHHNFSDIHTLEAAALCRWYFLHFGNARLFAQAETGLDFLLHDRRLIPAFLGALAAGWRYNYDRWFFESSLRAGYPFIWGAVLISFGYRI
jgi:hypothetical protein